MNVTKLAAMYAIPSARNMARRSAEKSDVTLSAWNKTKQHKVHHSRFDEGLTLETSAFKLFTVANLHYYPSW